MFKITCNENKIPLFHYVDFLTTEVVMKIDSFLMAIPMGQAIEK